MAYKIVADECLGCGACAPECPVDCIKEVDGKYVIDSELCLDCGECGFAASTKIAPCARFLLSFFGGGLCQIRLYN